MVSRQRGFDMRNKRLTPITAALLLFFLSGCAKVDQLQAKPLITPDQFLESMPYLRFSLFEKTFIFIQPTSTFFVYFLGLLTLCLGFYLLYYSRYEKSRIWWGYGLLLWGVGAIVAGTSYQAFGYELKCATLNYCRATSAWEIAYLLISCYSFNALLMAHTYTSVTQYKRVFLQKSALFSSVLYTGLIAVGILTGDRFLVSYECLLVFLLPNVLIFILLTNRRSRQYRSLMNRRIMNTWYFFLLINIIYLVYLYYGLGSQLYQSTGIWFNENDVLHVLLIVWMLRIQVRIIPLLRDVE